jgi:hypothetical protein
VKHPDYAKDADKYIHAYLLLQKDMLTLSDYVSNSDTNLKTHSFRIHELLVRACIEIEANFKAILRDNHYAKTANYNIADYHKTERTHRLSGYRVKIPYWDGEKSIRQPFATFQMVAGQRSPKWYRAYNATKHDRHENFKQANFEAMIDAIAGLAVLLAAQYINEDFSPVDSGISWGGYDPDTFQGAIGGYFRVFYPNDWSDADRYDFNWQALKDDPSPFATHNYNQ